MSLEENAKAECKTGQAATVKSQEAKVTTTVVHVTDVDGYAADHYNVIVEVKGNGISSRHIVGPVVTRSKDKEPQWTPRHWEEFAKEAEDPNGMYLFMGAGCFSGGLVIEAGQCTFSEGCLRVTVPGKSCVEAFRHAASELRQRLAEQKAASKNGASKKEVRNNHETHAETDAENLTTSSVERTHE